MKITVRGTPVPQGSIRSLGKGRPSIHGNAARLLPWREHVQHEAERVLAGAPPIEGPVRLEATFTMPKPKSAPKRRRSWATKRPDLSHLIRAVEDALTAAGVWRDDSQVVEIFAVKTYPGELAYGSLDVPGVVIVATPVPQETP